MRDFWWGFKEDGNRHLYLSAWRTVCSPKQSGGLGFRLCKASNEAFMTKLAWDILVNSNKIWVQLIRSKYLHGRNLLHRH